MRAIPVQINWHSKLPIFASEAFLKTVSDEYGWLGGVDSGGKLLCLLPYSVISKAFFRLVRFPVETIPLIEELDVDREREFLNSALDHFRFARVDLIIPATFNTVFRTYPDGALAAPFGSIIIDLSHPEEVLWKNLHQKHRNVIRNAMKKGVCIHNGRQYLETAYKLVFDSFNRSATTFFARKRLEARLNFADFKKQVDGFGENVKVLIAEYAGVVQGAAVIPFSDHTAYYMHGGSIANPLTGATNLLQWEAIKLFRELGVKRYDFFGARQDPEKGSKMEGIIKFKERFGGHYVHGYMWKFSFHSWKNSLYSLAARIRSGGDVVDQEMCKLKSAQHG